MNMDKETAEIISAAAKGTTEGFLNWTDEKIKKYVVGFKDKKFQFLEDTEVINRVKKDYNSGEIHFYDSYIDNKEKRILLSMGITLRTMPKERRSYLISRIIKRYETKGLHVSYLSQNEVLIKYIGSLISQISSLKDLKKKISNILDNVDSHAIFVKGSDTVERITEKAKSIMDVKAPSVFVLDGTGNESKKSKKVFNIIKDQMSDYTWTIETTSNRELFLFKKKII